MTDTTCAFIPLVDNFSRALILLAYNCSRVSTSLAGNCARKYSVCYVIKDKFFSLKAVIKAMKGP